MLSSPTSHRLPQQREVQVVPVVQSLLDLLSFLVHHLYHPFLVVHPSRLNLGAAGCKDDQPPLLLVAVSLSLVYLWGIPLRCDLVYPKDK